MTKVINEYGIPTWVALTTENSAAARRFYRGLLNRRERGAVVFDVMPDAISCAAARSLGSARRQAASVLAGAKRFRQRRGSNG
jgi:hypothetical protein